MELPEIIVPNAHLLQSDHLLKYIMETSVYPREPPILKELRDATAKDSRSTIALDPHSGQLLGMLLKLINPKRTLEIGVYTGYSLLATALYTPPDAKITAIDPKVEWYEIGLPFIKKAGVEHKIDFIHSLALPVLDDLLLQKENEGSFDFAFVDADKHNYGNYHDRLMKLVKIGGMIIYDNVLWGGAVANPDGQINAPEDKKKITMMAIEFNRRIAADDRVDICVAPVGDGLTICRRIS